MAQLAPARTALFSGLTEKLGKQFSHSVLTNRSYVENRPGSQSAYNSKYSRRALRLAKLMKLH
jgi:hypothetical protein